MKNSRSFTRAGAALAWPALAPLAGVCVMLALVTLTAPVAAEDSVAYEDLLELTGVFAAARASAHDVVERLRAENPIVPESVWSRFADRISDRASLAPLYVPIYARHLSEPDVQNLLAFYRSTLGTRWLEAFPRIQQACRAEAQAWAGTLIAESMSDSSDEKRDVANDAHEAAHLDRRRVTAIHDLLRASGAVVQAQQMMTLMLGRLQQGPLASELPAAFWTRTRAALADEASLLRLWTPAYAKYLTDEDVHGLTEFYRSPIGTKYVAALPAIQSESLEAATRFANIAARSAVREVLGPLPQWRLQHPETDESKANTQPSEH